MSFIAKAFGSMFSKPKPQFQAPPPTDYSAQAAEAANKDNEKDRKRAAAHSGTNITGGLLVNDDVKAQKKTLLSGAYG